MRRAVPYERHKPDEEGEMSTLMDRAVKAVASLPIADQDEIARLILVLATEPPEWLSADETAAIAEAEAEIARGEGVSEQEMRVFWRRHGL